MTNSDSLRFYFVGGMTSPVESTGVLFLQRSEHGNHRNVAKCCLACKYLHAKNVIFQRIIFNFSGMYAMSFCKTEKKKNTPRLVKHVIWEGYIKYIASFVLVCLLGNHLE